jgi:hypothetical protein
MIEKEFTTMDKFWMCYVEGSQGCSYRHEFKDSALQEAERLARMESNAGKKVFVIEAISFCKTEIKPVIWVEVQ